MSYIENLMDCWAVADKSGLDWYARAREQCQAIANEFMVPLETVVWCIATLSPGVPWDNGANIESAQGVLAIHFFANNNGYSIRAYGANVRKCLEYLEGKRSGLPSGPKVSAFYRNILGDWSQVTLDRHAIRAARQGVQNLDAASGVQDVSTIERSAILDAYLHCAEVAGVTPAQFQAAVWTLFNK